MGKRVRDWTVLCKTRKRSVMNPAITFTGFTDTESLVGSHAIPGSWRNLGSSLFSMEDYS
jgi:hypothetical protein